MTFTKCDICRKIINDYWKVARIEIPEHSRHDLCLDCAKKYLRPLMAKFKKDKKVGLKK